MFKNFFLLLVLGVGLQAQEKGPLNDLDILEAQLPPEIRQLKNWEIKGNQFFTGFHREEGEEIIRNQTLSLPHYDIPLELMRVHLDNMHPRTRQALVFSRNGKGYFRWIRNPQDTVHYKKVEAFLQKKGEDSAPKFHFIGHRTSSRSFFVQNPQDPTWVFNMKVSTDNTAGLYKSKHIPRQMVEDEIQVGGHVRKSLKEKKLQALKIMPESGLFSLPDIDQGAMVRDMLNLEANLDHPLGKNILLPGFSVVHEEVGKTIAEHNGGQDPQSYWADHFIIPYAHALAEFFAHTRTLPSSLHSQNVYLELDGNYRPTGKIVLKDFGDIYYMEQEIEDRSLREYLHKVNVEDMRKEDFNSKFTENFMLAFALFQTLDNKLPQWMDSQTSLLWRDQFFKAFENKYREISGKKLIESLQNPLGIREYFNWNLYSSPGIKECFKGNSKRRLEDCREVLTCTMVYCRKKRIFPPDKGDAQLGRSEVEKKERLFARCVREAEEPCENSLKEKVGKSKICKERAEGHKNLPGFFPSFLLEYPRPDLPF